MPLQHRPAARRNGFDRQSLRQQGQASDLGLALQVLQNSVVG